MTQLGLTLSCTVVYLHKMRVIGRSCKVYILTVQLNPIFLKRLAQTTKTYSVVVDTEVSTATYACFCVTAVTYHFQYVQMHSPVLCQAKVCCTFFYPSCAHIFHILSYVVFLITTIKKFHILAINL